MQPQETKLSNARKCWLLYLVVRVRGMRLAWKSGSCIIIHGHGYKKAILNGSSFGYSMLFGIASLFNTVSTSKLCREGQGVTLALPRVCPEVCARFYWPVQPAFSSAIRQVVQEVLLTGMILGGPSSSTSRKSIPSGPDQRPHRRPKAGLCDDRSRLGTPRGWSEILRETPCLHGSPGNVDMNQFWEIIGPRMCLLKVWVMWQGNPSLKRDEHCAIASSTLYFPTKCWFTPDRTGMAILYTHL